jgi:hypothetical protein
MSALHSDAAAILIAIPMICGLFLTVFRLDELYGRHGKLRERGHALSDWDEQGSPLCVEPDGAIHRRIHRRRNSGGAMLQRPLHRECEPHRKAPVSAPGGQARKVSTFLEPS